MFARRRRTLPLFAVLLSLSLVAAACGGGDDEGATGETATEDVREGGQIVYAAEQEPTGFNGFTSKDNLLELRHIMRNIWPQAYVTTPEIDVKPSPLLDGPAEVVSEDPFTVEWKIVEEAAWDDGVPVSADDLEWFWMSCNNKVDPGEPTAKDDAGKDITGVDCASTAGYDQVTKFEKVDPKTARATFEEPYVEFESMFGDQIPPSHIGKKRPGGWNTGFDADPGASAGPYRLKEWVKGKHFILERNEKYWGPRGKLDSIVYLQVPDPATHPDALRNGEVQLVYPQPQVDLLEQLNTVPAVETELNFGPTWEHVDFNFKNELLAIKEVRQAIAYGMDRNRYVNTLMKPFSPKASRLDNHVFMSNQPEYEANGAEYHNVAPAKATAAMEKAGFTKGADGIYAKDGKRASFRIRVKSPNPLREQLEQLMQDDLKKVGIELKIQNFSEPDTIGSVGSQGDFDLFIFAWVGTPFEVSGTQQVFASDSDSNFGKYANAEVDRLIKEAGTTLDEEERVKILNQIDEILWEDLATIPLFQKPAGVLSHADRYANLKDNTTSEGIFWNAHEWGLKATGQ